MCKPKQLAAATPAHTPSTAVYSNQGEQIHSALHTVVCKHLQHPYPKPIATHNQAAFEHLQQQATDKPARIILDSCCGTGYSSYQLAERYPDHWVIGIDRSAHRLQKSPSSGQERVSQRVTRVRSDCVDLWRLLVQADWQVEKHYILYPNPYPKAAQLKRRWHGHPVFACLLQLSRSLEIRSNWSVYTQEFAQAAQIAGYFAESGRYLPDNPPDKMAWSLFERKYALSGHTLYRCLVNLNKKAQHNLK